MSRQPGFTVSAASRRLLSGCALLALTAITAQAQQTTGIPGAPNATTTIDGRYLPPPPQKFQGEINLNAAQSKPAWPARVVPPKDAPNARSRVRRLPTRCAGLPRAEARRRERADDARARGASRRDR